MQELALDPKSHTLNPSSQTPHPKPAGARPRRFCHDQNEACAAETQRQRGDARHAVCAHALLLALALACSLNPEPEALRSVACAGPCLLPYSRYSCLFALDAIPGWLKIVILDLISHSEWEEAMSEARERADVEGRKELERMERARLRRLELDEEINEQVPPIEETSIEFRCPFRTLPCTSNSTLHFEPYPALSRSLHPTWLAPSTRCYRRKDGGIGK